MKPSIFDFLLDLSREKLITWEVNELRVLRVYQLYNEHINGRRIYGRKKKKLININLDAAINDPYMVIAEIEANIVEDKHYD